MNSNNKDLKTQLVARISEHCLWHLEKNFEESWKNFRELVFDVFEVFLIKPKLYIKC